MKELSTEFNGVGEVRGFIFKQLEFNGIVYMYEVKNIETGGVHYEVFERVVNESFGCVSYPRSKSFGVWAWCIHDYEKAKRKFNETTKKVENRMENRK